MGVHEHNVAFIPVRGGSKSIPLKNIKPICGKPLVYWTVKAACGCQSIDRVYVATDSKEIKETVESFKKGAEGGFFSKLEVIGRSAESASDTASTESAMLEFAEGRVFDNIVLIQATSPLLTSGDLDKGFELFNQADTDSVLSVVKQKRFNWGYDSDGCVRPLNYDVFHRPRRQEFDGYLVENGAFYITSREDLLRTRNRVSGRMRAVEMDEASFFEIDEPSDWLVIEQMMKNKGLSGHKTANGIKVILTDCDGCLTDSGMYYSNKGDELKKFNTKDGMGFSIARHRGLKTGLVTGEAVELNKRRVDKLKMDFYIPGCRDKLSAVKALCEEKGFSLDEVLYVGDDINDLELLKAAGFSCCPADAVEAVREAVDYISPRKGGEGVIRDVVDSILCTRTASYSEKMEQ